MDSRNFVWLGFPANLRRAGVFTQTSVWDLFPLIISLRHQCDNNCVSVTKQNQTTTPQTNKKLQQHNNNKQPLQQNKRKQVYQQGISNACSDDFAFMMILI